MSTGFIPPSSPVVYATSKLLVEVEKLKNDAWNYTGNTDLRHAFDRVIQLLDTYQPKRRISSLTSKPDGDLPK